MRILEVTEFSFGADGVFQRVISEGKEFLKNGHEVKIFSSFVNKNSDKRLPEIDYKEDLEIRRFGDSKTQSIFDKMLTKNVTYFAEGDKFKKEIEEYDPEVVITHLIHPHSFAVLRICKEKNVPCILVTHAPFNVKRNFFLSLATNFWYKFKVQKEINNFDKIIRITNWELNYLKELKIQDEKIEYIPNGLSDKYFRKKRVESDKRVLFLGRISPVKNIELLLNIAKNIPEIEIDIVGSAEKDYLDKIQKIIDKEEIKNVNIKKPVFDEEKKIDLIDRYSVFLLPSKREAMPIALLEAKARGKIVICSETDGSNEIVSDGIDGFIFQQEDYKKAANLIKENISGNPAIEKRAIFNSRQYSWKTLINKYEKIFSELKHD